jgi:Flp pilus assembly protein TadB
MTNPETHSSLRQDRGFAAKRESSRFERKGTGPDDKTKAWLSRFVWLCPFLAIAVATGILLAFGVSFFTAVVVALLLVCPALLVWGAVTVRRRLRSRRPMTIEGAAKNFSGGQTDLYGKGKTNE